MVVYKASAVPAEKLVIGFVVYGRAWENGTLTRSSISHAEVAEWMRREGKEAERNVDGAFFTTGDSPRVEVHFEDTESLVAKLRILESAGVVGTTFWRIGLEPAEL